MKRAIFLLTVLAFCFGRPAARAADSGLEYRLKVEDGVPFAFNQAEDQYFSPLPFMTAADFASARALKWDNPNTPGDWEVVLTHTAIGRAKIRAVADADRSREYCLVFHGTLYQCLAFQPVLEGVYDRGLSFGSRLTQAMAVKLAGEMAAEIRCAHAKQPIREKSHRDCRCRNSRRGDRLGVRYFELRRDDDLCQRLSEPVSVGGVLGQSRRLREMRRRDRGRFAMAGDAVGRVPGDAHVRQRSGAVGKPA